MKDSLILFCSSKFPGTLARNSSKFTNNLDTRPRKVSPAFCSWCSYRATIWMVPCSNSSFSSSPHRPDRICDSPSPQYGRSRVQHPVFFFSTPSVAHPASCSVGIGYSFEGVKRPGCEIDHLPPSNTDLKTEWSHISPPLYSLVEDMDDLAAPVAENAFLNTVSKHCSFCSSDRLFCPAQWHCVLGSVGRYLSSVGNEHPL